MRLSSGYAFLLLCNCKSGNILNIDSLLTAKLNQMQESICADAASFDLPSSLLTSCISEAKNCIDICVNRRESSDDKSNNPDNYAILRGKLN